MTGQTRHRPFPLPAWVRTLPAPLALAALASLGSFAGARTNAPGAPARPEAPVAPEPANRVLTPDEARTLQAVGKEIFQSNPLQELLAEFWRNLRNVSRHEEIAGRIGACFMGNLKAHLGSQPILANLQMGSRPGHYKIASNDRDRNVEVAIEWHDFANFEVKTIWFATNNE